MRLGIHRAQEFGSKRKWIKILAIFLPQNI